MTVRLTIDGVFTTYDRVDVLDDITLEVAPGRITCIL
ncbi:MAG: ABC transporter ATP-binding protein, partial [Parafilimonas terrae]|nr:ABC transporter ATP-binding protein [Parafilimonas terrae]